MRRMICSFFEPPPELGRPVIPAVVEDAADVVARVPGFDRALVVLYSMPAHPVHSREQQHELLRAVYWQHAAIY